MRFMKCLAIPALALSAVCSLLIESVIIKKDQEILGLSFLINMLENAKNKFTIKFRAML